MMMKILELMMQMVVRREGGQAEDDGWMVVGSSGWRVDSRSPKIKKSKNKGQKWE
jgi:hypothetical protein